MTILLAQVLEELNEVSCIFFKLTAEQVLLFRFDRRLKSVFTLGEKKGVRGKAKFWCKLTPDVFLTILPTYSLHNLRLGSS